MFSPLSIESNTVMYNPRTQGQRNHSEIDSFKVLMDLACNEPTIQQCLTLIDNICLCRELDFNIIEKDKSSSKRARLGPQGDFKRFINRHYIPFLKDAIRSMHTLGFVLWTTVKLESGDNVPEVVPMGTFTWRIMPNDSNNQSILEHVIKFQQGIREIPHKIKIWTKPNYNVCEQSSVYPTVPTPMCHLIEEYIVLRRTMRRHHHADAWNCTARVIVSDEPKTFAHDAEKKELFETIDFLKGVNKAAKSQQCDPVEEMFFDKPSDHTEMVYPLPPHRHIEGAPVLQPVTDIAFLLNRFKTNACALMGIPVELLSGVTSGSGGGSVTSKSALSINNTVNRMFHVKMLRVAGFLSELASEAYAHIYKGEEADFHIMPMPRLEIECIDDLKVLFEIGVLQPGASVDLSEILLGSLKRSRQRKN